MDIFFSDPDEIPLPPGEIRFRDIQVNPIDDSNKIKIYIEIDPFQKKPNIDLVVFNNRREIATSVNIIESIQRKIEIIAHLKRNTADVEFNLEAKLYYSEIEDEENNNGKISRFIDSIVDKKEFPFNLQTQDLDAK